MQGHANQPIPMRITCGVGEGGDLRPQVTTDEITVICGTGGDHGPPSAT